MKAERDGDRIVFSLTVAEAINMYNAGEWATRESMDWTSKRFGFRFPRDARRGATVLRNMAAAVFSLNTETGLVTNAEVDQVWGVSYD